MYENIHLEKPYFLLLILVFVLVSIYFKQTTTSYYIPHILQYIPNSHKRKYLKSILKWVALVSVIVALSTPVTTKEITIVKEDSIDIVLSLDTSGSMSMNGFSEEAYEKSRWDVVVEVVKKFVATRDKDRIGLVVFGTTTAVISPLSHENEVQIDLLDNINVGIVGKSTVLVDSLLTSINLLKESKSKSKIIILLSDGDDSASKVPLSIVLKLAKKYQIKIYTISIGESNNNMLKYISKKSGTKSFDAMNKEDLVEIYEKIDSLETVKSQHNKVEIKEQMYFYFLTVGIFLFSLILLFYKKDEEL